MRVSLGLIVGLFILSACQTRATQAPNRAEGDMPQGLISALSVLPASGLGPQNLASGECGLFLWSKTDTEKFIFFTKAQTGRAQMAQAKGAVSLLQTGGDGDIFGQFTTRMTYKASRQAQSITLDLVPGELLEGGQRLEKGLLTTTDAEGWRTKLPVLGVRACQPN